MKVTVERGHVSCAQARQTMRSFFSGHGTQHGGPSDSTLYWVLAAESAAASSQKTWINASGCAYLGFGLVWAQHPATIGVTCDPHDQIVGARWRNWGQANTQATATLVVDNCNPNCGTGRVRRYAITLLASKIRRCGTRRVYGSVIFYETIAGRRRTGSVPAEGFC